MFGLADERVPQHGTGQTQNKWKRTWDLFF